MPNLYKPLSFHLSNLSNNGIILSKYQVKYLLQKVRDFKYTNDEDYLKDISNIQITYDNNPDLDKLPMCYKYVNFINPKKKQYKYQNYYINNILN